MVAENAVLDRRAGWMTEDEGSAGVRGAGAFEK